MCHLVFTVLLIKIITLECKLNLVQKKKNKKHYFTLETCVEVCVFHWPTGLKLKSRGSSRPLGRRVLGWRSSSKNAWAQASSGERRVTGVYSSRREHREMASGGVLGLNTWTQKSEGTWKRRVSTKIIINKQTKHWTCGHLLKSSLFAWERGTFQALPIHSFAMAKSTTLKSSTWKT